jgi:enoyl-CoA hydratase
MSASADPGPGSPVLIAERRDGIVLLTLNRPHKLNALNGALQTELTSAVRGLGQDPGVRCIILTGSGRGFCAGLDLSDIAASLGSAAGLQGHGEDAKKKRDARNVFLGLETLPMPTIAAVNGPAYTGGFELALACDLLIASPEARFGDTHAALAVMPGAGLSQKLSRVVGLPRAMAISLAGETLDGEAAYRCGLVSHLVPGEQLLPQAWRLAGAIAAVEPGFAVEMKRLIKEGAAMPLEAALGLEKETHRRWAASAELGAVQARTGQAMQRSRASLSAAAARPFDGPSPEPG